MPTITLSYPTAGTVVSAGLHAANYAAIANLVNGLLDSANLATNAVTTDKITDLAVTGAKIANATIALGKLSATGTPSASTFLRGDNTWSGVSGGMTHLGLAERTTDLTATGTTEAAANTVMTMGALTFDADDQILIEFSAVLVELNLNEDIFIWLYDGASSIGCIGQILNVSNDNTSTAIYCRRQLTPGASTKTYSIRASSPGGTGIIRAGAGGAGVNAPALMTVKKIAG